MPYDCIMMKLLEKALEVVRQLSDDGQDEIARAMLALAGGSAEGVPVPVPVTADEQRAIARSKAAAARGEFAGEDQVRAVWEKHGL